MACRVGPDFVHRTRYRVDALRLEHAEQAAVSRYRIGRQPGRLQHRQVRPVLAQRHADAFQITHAAHFAQRVALVFPQQQDAPADQAF
jgi:hypothetical protein